MDVSTYVDPGRVITLTAKTKEEVIRSLVTALVRSVPGLDRDVILNAVGEREKAARTRLSPTFAMPHARVPQLPDACYITIGRAPDGIEYEKDDPELVRLVTLIVVREDEPELFLNVLAHVAKVLSDPKVETAILNADSPEEVLGIFSGGVEAEPAALELGWHSVLLIRTAGQIAEQVNARAVMVCSDAEESAVLLRELPAGRRLILAGRRAAIPKGLEHSDVHVVEVPFGGDFRTRRIQLALLFCVGRGLLAPADTVVCLTGLPGEGLADTMIVTSVSRECHTFDIEGAEDLLSDVRPEVLERAVQLACEIAEEGREGKPLGTLFVLGDSKEVQKRSRQLVMNPFQGYSEDARNILDPTLGETIKEFASIDGAFIIRGDGVVTAAGTYLTPGASPTELPAGYGTRHQAAAAISAVTKAYGIAVSESTGTVTVYKHGATLTTIERGRRTA